MVKVMRSIVGGPLEPHIAGFARGLLSQGYTQTSAEQQVCFLAHLDRWLSAEGVGLGELTGSAIERYLAGRRAAGYVEYRSVKALRPLLDFLGPLGVLPVDVLAAPGPVEALLAGYRDYLVGERGLTAGTARGYVDCVRLSSPPDCATMSSIWPASCPAMSPGSCCRLARAGLSGRRS